MIDSGIWINILTRTSGRPNGFNKCRKSIENQTYLHINHIVSYDNNNDLPYLKKCDCKKIKVRPPLFKTKKVLKNPKDYKPYNLYCNKLLKEVKDGWIMFLDDDDMLYDSESIQKIVDIVAVCDENTLFLWQTQYPDGRLLPNKNVIDQEEIVFQQIDTACFLFHSKYKKSAQWDAWGGADFRFIRDLAGIIPHKHWIPEVYTKKNNFGDGGRRNDIQE